MAPLRARRSNEIRSLRSRKGAALAALGASLLVGLLASGLAAGMVVARDSSTAEVTLQLWPAGQGRIEVTQGGTNLTPECGFVAIVVSTSNCVVTVTTGTPVTLKAVAQPGSEVTLPEDQKADVPDFPVPQPSFVRWSRFECGTAASCTFTPEADSDQDWITALFTPLQLQVGVFGVDVGKVTLRGSDGSVVVRDVASQEDCPANNDARWCHAAFPAETDVVVEVSQTPSGWGAGCEPEGNNPVGQRCTVEMTNLRTFALVRFGEQVPDQFQPPFQLTPKVKVKRGGSGQGRVTGTGIDIDCPSKCEVQVDYQARVRLKAEESPGSRFVGWVGVCSTDPSCVFAAGSATEVQARFDTAPTATTPTTTTPPPTTTTTPTTTGTTAATTTTTTTTTKTTTTTTTREPKRPRLEGVSARGQGIRRVVAFALVVDRRARATARLLKQRKTIVSRSYGLAKGRNARRLAIPRTAKPGLYRLSVRVSMGRQVRTLVAPVRIRR